MLFFPIKRNIILPAFLLELKGLKQEVVKKKRFEKVSVSFREVQKLRTRIWGLAALLIVIVVAGSISIIYFEFFRKDVEAQFRNYANQYSDSVAFVMVEYSLKQGKTPIYTHRAEGTAFLVDEEGHLVTNRHVAAPWMVDRNLFIIIEQIKGQNLDLWFDYRMFLWFEGQKAYKHLPTLEDSTDLADIYHLESAFKSNGKPRLSIAGISRSAMQQGYFALTSLKDDFAILKIDKVPEGLKPLPLEEDLNALNIPKLSPVITIGFPLGSRTQANSVNVSVTKGNVRRTFNDIIQVDTSLYKGNSGGPIIDTSGKVIGIATGVAFDKMSSRVPILAPLSDIGMVLPITKIVPFLKELKNGEAKWNGVLDLSLEKKISSIKNMAFRGDWHLARKRADNELRYSLEPALFTTAGVMHFCTGDYRGAKQLFKQAMTINPNNSEAMMMYYLIDWINGNSLNSEVREKLSALNWRSNSEFYGYLTKVLEGTVDLQSAYYGWNTPIEKSWIYYISAQLYDRKGLRDNAVRLYRKSAITAPKNSWVLYLALVEMFQVFDQKLVLSRNKSQKSQVESEINAFYTEILTAQTFKKKKLDKMTPLFSRLLHPSVKVAEKRIILTRIREIDTDNKETLVALAFFSAMEGDLNATLSYIQNFLSKGGREDRAFLSIKLLEFGALHKIGTPKQAILKELNSFYDQINDPWYKDICRNLIAKNSKLFLSERADISPENLITLHFALGLWAEGTNKKEKTG